MMRHSDIQGTGVPLDLPFLLIDRAIRAAAEPEPDLVEAHKWLNIAAFEGSAEAAERRRELAAEMSPAQVATAQRAAREWMSRH